MLNKWHEQHQPPGEGPGNPQPQEADANDALAQSILDSVDIIMAILDANGSIRVVNRAWRQIAEASCSREQRERTGRGVNYLEVCRLAQGTGSEEAPAAFAGIEAVLQGKQPSFMLEYHPI
jgi:hypothetical protein